MNKLITMRKFLDGPMAPFIPAVFPWRPILLAMYGEELTDDEASQWRELTGTDQVPTTPLSELVAAVGRRGGKTFAMTLAVLYSATMIDWSKKLAPGERARAMWLSATVVQAQQALNYAKGIVDNCPLLSRLDIGQTQDTIRFSTGVDLVIQTASYKSIRGWSACICVADEAAFFNVSEDAANPDVEVINAILPGLINLRGMLVVASSPYGKQGYLWEAYQRLHGKPFDGRSAFVHAPTLRMNPSIDSAEIDLAIKRDPVRAGSEYGAAFRDELSNYISEAIVDGVTSAGVKMRPYDHTQTYFCFVDPAGGSGEDSFTAAFAHAGENEMIILDCVVEIRPPFSPEEAIAEIATYCRAYDVAKVTGDGYASLYPREIFERHSIRYKLSEANRSTIYAEVLPSLNMGRCDLIDNERMRKQFAGLQRKITATGRENINHGKRGHDDACNAAAGALYLVLHAADGRAPIGYSAPPWADASYFSDAVLTQAGFSKDDIVTARMHARHRARNREADEDRFKRHLDDDMRRRGLDPEYFNKIRNRKKDWEDA